MREDSLVRKIALLGKFNTVFGEIWERPQSTHGNLSLVSIWFFSIVVTWCAKRQNHLVIAVGTKSKKSKSEFAATVSHQESHTRPTILCLMFHSPTKALNKISNENLCTFVLQCCPVHSNRDEGPPKIYHRSYLHCRSQLFFQEPRCLQGGSTSLPPSLHELT